MARPATPARATKALVAELRAQGVDARHAVWRLRELQQGNIAPVDLAQAAIGPGMAVFSRYAKVVEPTGEAMPVRSALGLINQVLDEVLAEQEGEFDADTRFAIKWFEQYGLDEVGYDPAEGLARETNVSVKGLEEAGILPALAECGCSAVASLLRTGTRRPILRCQCGR